MHAVTFAFTPLAGTPQQAIDGFAAAGARWSAQFTDPVTVNITIGYEALSPGVLGSAGSTRETRSYTSVRNAMAGDASSADDAAAVANLPIGSSFGMYLNYTSNNPNGAGSATPYVDNDGDANNTTIRLTSANSKALGLRAADDPAEDASIRFSSLFSWDFDRSNGISSGSYDFVGVAMHEIGHALGFVSGVDVLDTNSPNGTTYYADSAFSWVSPLDLFRYSTASVAAGVIDWTAGTAAKSFSLDGGDTFLASFSTGRVHGDGQQASHWKDSQGLGLMDPTAASGESLAISTMDLRGLDVIGWSLAPEPVAPCGPLLLLTGLLGRRRRRADGR